jgi:hypothetical protein
MRRNEATQANRALAPSTTAHSGLPDFETCIRCGGLMVREACMDLQNSTDELDCLVARCVQCGEILDPVILRNRRRQMNIPSISGDQVSAHSVSVPVAA